MYQLAAIAITSTGRELDVTATAIWASSDSSIARFDEGFPGRLVGVSRGLVTITARVVEVDSEAVLDWPERQRTRNQK